MAFASFGETCVELAPEFLNSITATGEKTLSWAQSVSEKLVREIHVVSVPRESEDLKMRMGDFVADLHEKKKELADMDRRIRRVYDQIRPSVGHSDISRLQVNEEKFRALEILSAFSKQLETILLGWESLLYAVENGHVSLQEAYAANSSKLTVQSTTGFTETAITPFESINQKQDSLEKIDGINSSNLAPPKNLEIQVQELPNDLGFDVVILKKTPFLGISNLQWIIITILGLGVVLVYGIISLIVLRILTFGKV